jgi:hypothetical protein
MECLAAIGALGFALWLLQCQSTTTMTVKDYRNRIEPAPDSGIFPVHKSPPPSHYYPERDKKKRKMEQQVRTRGREIIAAAPHLADLKYRHMLLSPGKRFRNVPHQQQVGRACNQKLSSPAPPVDGPFYSQKKLWFALDFVQRHRR